MRILDRVPVRLRLSLGHAIGMALVFALVGVALYRVVEHNLDETFDAALLASAKAIRDNRSRSGFSPPLLERFLHQFFGEKYVRPYAQLVNLSGKVTARTDQRVSFPTTKQALRRAERGLTTFETFPDRNGAAPLRQVTLPVMKFGRFANEIVQVAAPYDNVHVLRELRWVLYIALPVGLVISIFIGYFITRRAFSPVKDISIAAAGLGSDDLSLRLPLPPAHDELRRLTLTFNAMLDRLEDAFKRLRRFSGDVSHELRTPIAVLRGEAELALRRNRSGDEYKAALKNIVAEASNMTVIVEDLLLLARAESRVVAIHHEEIDLTPFLNNVKNAVAPKFKENSVTLRVDDRGPKRIRAHESYLSLALRNLLLNAAKHSNADSSVELTITDDNDDILFTVTDSGEGIPEESLPYIFDPFFRADTARNRAAGGAGIGLSLAMALIKLHKGNIGAQSIVGKGSTFTIRMPKRATPPRSPKKVLGKALAHSSTPQAIQPASL